MTLTHNGEAMTHVVRLESPHTIFGDRLKAMRALKELRAIEWIRASGDVTAFWYDQDGKRRQKTYRAQDVRFHSRWDTT